MKQLDLGTKLKIIEKRLEGGSFEDIAKELKIAKSTAFNVYSEFESGKAYYLDNPELYLLADQFKDIARVMQEKKLSASEFLKVYGLWSIIRHLGLPIEKSLRYLKMLEDSKDPESIVSSFIYIQDFAEKNGKTMSFIIDSIIENLDSIEKLKNEIEEMKKLYEKAKKHLISAVQKETEVEQRIKKYETELKIIKALKRTYRGDYKAAIDFITTLKKEQIGNDELKDLIALFKYFQRNNVFRQEMPKLLRDLQFLEGAGFTLDSLGELTKEFLGKDARQIAIEIYNYIESKKYLDSQIEEKNKKFDELEKDIESKKRDIEKLEDKNDELEKKINEHKKLIEDYKINERALRREIENLNLKINIKRELIKALEDKIAQATSFLDYLVQASGELPGYIRTFKELSDDIQNKKDERERLVNEIDKLNKTIEALTNKIEEISKKAENPAINEPKFVLIPKKKSKIGKNFIIEKKYDQGKKKIVFVIRNAENIQKNNFKRSE